MVSQHIVDKISSIYPLAILELEVLLAAMERLEFPKGHLVMRADKVERYVYIIEKGIARAYSDANKQQTTFWFGEETDFILSYNSYANGQPGYENIELLEDSALYRIANSTLQQLYSHYIGLSNWGRKVAELELIKTEERLINRQFKTAAERYRELMINTPSLIKRVQLGYIASYLGITQVTLSRIRADLK